MRRLKISRESKIPTRKSRDVCATNGAMLHEAEDVLCGGADKIHNLPPYRTYIFPSYRDFSASSDEQLIDDSQLVILSAKCEYI